MVTNVYMLDHEPKQNPPVFHTSLNCPKVRDPYDHYLVVPRWALRQDIRKCRTNGACQKVS